MEPKYSIKRTRLVVITAVAQENSSEISIPGTGSFTKGHLRQRRI
jgi:hypothetical protein